MNRPHKEISDQAADALTGRGHGPVGHGAVFHGSVANHVSHQSAGIAGSACAVLHLGFIQRDIFERSARSSPKKADITGIGVDGQVADGVAAAVEGAFEVVTGTGADGGPGLATQVDVGGQHRAGGGVLFHALQGAIDQAGEPEQFVRSANLVGAFLGALAIRLAVPIQRRAPAQDDGHSKAGRVGSQGIPLGKLSRKGVFALGGLFGEALAGPGKGQLHGFLAAVHRGGDAGGQQGNHRVKVHGVLRTGTTQKQDALIQAVRTDPFPGRDGLFRRILLGIAEFAVRRVKGAGASLGIAAGFIVDVLAVQFLCDAAAFHAAHMGTGACFLHIRVRRGSGIL